ncbi:hypothetical protein [Actinocrispum wychmicini]|uniref:Uncharacterized protein n=1 Tax=Actinocrispum wychmicini TaxID=1213861 RepID=A0A4R2JNC6_9PSEU|nr:hypothetical protein [Actinocrispum wychmicini]TCO55685.1 hypothetical protein EV192_107107 [Actinocrispum wychmicini]
MTTTENDTLAHQVELVIGAIGDADALVRMLTAANDQRPQTDPDSPGRVWFFYASPAHDAPCLVVGVRGTVGALE